MNNPKIIPITLPKKVIHFIIFVLVGLINLDILSYTNWSRELIFFVRTAYSMIKNKIRKINAIPSSMIFFFIVFPFIQKTLHAILKNNKYSKLFDNCLFFLLYACLIIV